MSKTLMLIIFFGWALASYGQGVEELDRRNGFKDIKMTSLVSSYEGLEYKKDIEDEVFPNSKVYVPKKGYYENIGNIKIHELEVMSYIRQNEKCILAKRKVHFSYDLYNQKKGVVIPPLRHL